MRLSGEPLHAPGALFAGLKSLVYLVKSIDNGLLPLLLPLAAETEASTAAAAAAAAAAIAAAAAAAAVESDGVQYTVEIGQCCLT